MNALFVYANTMWDQHNDTIESENPNNQYSTGVNNFTADTKDKSINI